MPEKLFKFLNYLLICLNVSHHLQLVTDLSGELAKDVRVHSVFSLIF